MTRITSEKCEPKFIAYYIRDKKRSCGGTNAIERPGPAFKGFPAAA
jgi:hypothetical protein